MTSCSERTKQKESHESVLGDYAGLISFHLHALLTDRIFSFFFIFLDMTVLNAFFK